MANNADRNLRPQAGSLRTTFVSASNPANQYVDLKNNGRIFPSWVLHNFKKYKLPEIFRNEDEDPCNIQVKKQLRAYQEFIGQYLGAGSPYNEALLYHGLGSGKTATSINLMNILYNYDHNYNFIILIKASLRDDPWMTDLKDWLGRDPSEEGLANITGLGRFKNIHFVHYDSPYADRDFMNIMKTIDGSKPIMYVIDEAHNFIRNVYSNLQSGTGKRAQVIYDYIFREKRDNKNAKIILITATPGINVPFELALMFNLLRPGIFPSSEAEFNKTYITDSVYPILNPLRRNMFERRIMGLVSYYIGATPDLYAHRELEYVNLPMSTYQYNVYRIFEKAEAEIQLRARRSGRQSKLYRTYTRQASNFVFPYVSANVNGELRPRPYKFRVSNKVAEEIAKGKEVEVKDEQDREMLNRYNSAIALFLTETEKYFKGIDKDDAAQGRTITDDLNEFKEGFKTKYKSKFLNYYLSDSPKSRLFTAMYDSSPKMLAITFYTFISPGKVMVYTNYVVMEGIDVMKIYYRLTGFNDFTIAKANMGYCEYHGRIDRVDRDRTKAMFNEKDNVLGLKCKIIIISPSATEGIQLLNIRQEHILEPYWNEVRIQQVIGRGIRQCSHKDLPMADRTVTVYRYKVIKPTETGVKDEDDTIRHSTDEIVEDQAKAKSNLNESFLSAMREAAVDCDLFRNHNMMTQSYTCFKFPEKAIMGPNVGSAYKEDMKEDIKYDSGLHAKNSRVERIKVIRINGVYTLSINAETDEPIYSNPDKYWYYQKTGMVYDFETHYPVGQVLMTNNLPNKLDKETYIISVLIDIPTIVRDTNNP